jgi:hypothetical protein
MVEDEERWVVVRSVERDLHLFGFEAHIDPFTTETVLL